MGTSDPEDDGLEEAVEQLGQSRSWLWMVVLLASTPSMVNTFHLTVYVFWGQSLEHWCDVPALQYTNWTADQIRNVSNPGGVSRESCELYNWNYSQLAEMSYPEAVLFTGSQHKPSTTECQHWNYVGNGIVSEWDLVCSRKALKSTAQMAISLGKFLGALISGLVADRYGRKKVFATACMIYIIAGPVVALAPYYTLFILARIALGIAGSGTHNCGFTLLAESCTTKRRTVLAVLYYMPTPIGMMLLPLIAYHIDDWRTLQFVISAPAVFFVIHIWFLPESPRWLLSQGRREEAWRIVNAFQSEKQTKQFITVPLTSKTEDVTEPPESNPPTTQHWYQHVLPFIYKLSSLFSHTELRNDFSSVKWILHVLTLKINADNFTADRYIYVATAGAVEVLSYIMPLPLLRWTGRRQTLGLLYFLSSATLLSILMVPEGRTTTVWIVAMLGRLCVGAVYSLIVIQTSELFPTTNRNTAVSTSSTLAHVGSLSAPFIVDLLGAEAWYIPSTICGCSVLVAGFLVLLLPETKNSELCNTVEEILQTDRVSFRNCCSCSS
ncbi:hypothetical protein ANN_20694 [Periplaneta americana]|uniref:Major facilitator superfamily (MFS) profile domain-containing protein n=1 Tax=Periplaneta americana TaxID=6978 RepID=A0ABQ8SE33_PERAM|nr:hypothetical protein ANN_20694 [Periplaneta americana]